MSHGFSRTKTLDGLARDPNAGSPTSFETNLIATTAAERLGTTITASATINTKGSYTTLIASTAQTAYGIWVTGFDVQFASAVAGQLLDIATGAAGVETNIISNIDMGAATSSLANSQSSNGKIFYFPGLFIPSGTRISARTQATNASDTLVLAIWLDYRTQWHIANTSWVTYGANTATSAGTSVPRAANTFGAWTTIGTTSRQHNLWSVGLDYLADSTGTSQTALVEIGYGPDAGSITSIGVLQCLFSTNEGLAGCFPPVLVFSVASGSILWARIAAADTENRGVIIYGN